MEYQFLINKYGFWNDHPRYPASDWKYEVQNNDTRIGYWEWVLQRIIEGAEMPSPTWEPPEPE